ncbi:MAG: hypothetical protein JM58_17855 [Peptococcaceae bacterium BICA1-8]|nr:MAG: hypothetical protein JM58_17855 [Peptococcaceae bacterium BICA1-8]
MSLPILIVGAGYEQYPLIKRAADRGLYVIAVDKNPDAYGFFFADESHIISVRDEKSILKLAGEKKIKGITSLISEVPLPTIGAVSKQLGFPVLVKKVLKQLQINIR